MINRHLQRFAMLQLVFLAAILAPQRVLSFPSYTKQLPNSNFFNPAAYLGHGNPTGGPLTDFGLDFKFVGGTKWNKAFCQTDSDGDGQTNGQELGDPCCEWDPKAGGAPLFDSGVSNPADKTSTADATRWASLKCEMWPTTTGSQSSSGSNSTTTKKKFVVILSKPGAATTLHKHALIILISNMLAFWCAL